MDEVPDWSDARYRMALRNLKQAIDDYRRGGATGLLTLDELDALDAIVTTRKQTLKLVAATLLTQQPTREKVTS